MGSPKKLRSKVKGPGHPWQRSRIESEKEIQKTFGLKSKNEIWKASSEIRTITAQAKKLIGDRNSVQSKLEQKQLLDRLGKLGLLPPESTLEDVLALTASDLLNRRLQTIVSKKGLALTAKQARQFIIHGHIQINGNKVTVPSYVVPISEEFNITFVPTSALAQEDHPERTKEKKGKAGKKETEEEVETKKELKELEEIEKKVGKVEE